MDCQTALEILDCVRPDSDDLDLPEMADARAHLDSCTSCQEAFAEMQRFDRAVTNILQDVEIPDGLHSSLLKASLNGTTAETLSVADGPELEVTITDEAVRSRRRKLQTVVSAAIAVLIGATAWLWQSQPVQFAEGELLRMLPIDLSATEPFDSGFELDLPAPFSGNPRLRVGREFRGIDLDDKVGHDAAVAIFSYSPARDAPINGILAAIPADRVAPLPESISFAQADARYIRKDGRRPVAAVWRERDTVYLCLVLGSAADLEQIQRSLTVATA